MGGQEWLNDPVCMRAIDSDRIDSIDWKDESEQSSIQRGTIFAPDLQIFITLSVLFVFLIQILKYIVWHGSNGPLASPDIIDLW